jgi:hypothetical protein
MLLYHPFFDAYHCTFRLLRLLETVGRVEVETPRLRVWDFYLLFPAALQDAQLPRGSTSLRSAVQKTESRYEVLPDARRAFTRLEPIQNAALAHLAATKLINADSLKSGKVVRTEQPVPDDMTKLIHEKNAQTDEVLKFLVTRFLEVPMFGKGGIRKRTDLFDNRYDPI